MFDPLKPLLDNLFKGMLIVLAVVAVIFGLLGYWFARGFSIFM